MLPNEKIGKLSRIILISVLAIVMLASLSKSARGCNCTCNSGTPVQMYDMSYIVFSGKVTKIEDIQMETVTMLLKRAGTLKPEKTVTLEKSAVTVQKVTFDIEENLKEVLSNLKRGRSKTVEILSIPMGNCGTPTFKEGMKVFIFGSLREPLLSKEEAELPEEQRTEKIRLKAQADKFNENLPLYEISPCANASSLKEADIEAFRSLSQGKGLPPNYKQ